MNQLIPAIRGPTTHRIASKGSEMSDATIPVQAAPPPRLSEDLVAVGLGLAVFLLALVSLAGADALGWLVTTSVWTDPSAA